MNMFNPNNSQQWNLFWNRFP